MIAAQLKSWMTSVVLPFWTTQGVDAETGAFQERFHPDGTPDLTAPRRLRVQARQIYVLSHADCLGWSENASTVALRAFDYMMAQSWGAGGAPGFAQALTCDGAVHDPRRDAYDHAFVVLALSWLHRATGESRVEAALAQTLDFIDSCLTDPSGALYENDIRAQPRRQNPQMHWFEASLALRSTERVARGVTLFQSRFFDRASGMVAEYYDDRWNRAVGDAGEAVEPGHLAEWSWLLRQAGALLGQDLSNDADRLLAAAIPHRAPMTQLLWDEIGRDGTVRLNTSRSWPMTELAKAYTAKAEAGDAQAQEKAEEALSLLKHHFLGKPFAAGWLDRIDETGQPLGLMVSGSTLYHIFVAISEADRVFNRTS
jgi:mannose/cellobiose epimerase-like protein (N-acyl-D-glucosamine 2-epimerase family)